MTKPVSPRRKALIIDDDPDIREILQVMLEMAGFEVDFCRDGIDALRIEVWYDVILLDMRMPVFDGERLADYWMLTQPELLRRVIMLSGYSRYTRERELPSAIFATIEKPFEHAELIRVVNACAAQPRPQERPDSEHIPELEQSPIR